MTAPASPSAALLPEQAIKPSGGWASFLRLLTMLGPYRGQVAASAITAWGVVAARVALPWLTGIVINDLKAGDFNINREIWLLIAAGFAVAVLNGIRRLFAGTISLGLEKTLREQLFSHLSGLRFSFFDNHQTGQLLSRMTVDVTQVRFFLGYGFTYFFMHIGTLLIVPVLLFLISPVLAVVVYAMMPVIVLLSLRYSRLSTPVLKETQQREADVTTAAEENIIGARVVRAFGQEETEVQRFEALSQRVVDKESENLRISAVYRPLYKFIPSLAQAVVVLLGARLIEQGAINLGEFFAFYLYLLQLTGPLRIIGNLLGRAQRAAAAGERLFELLDVDERLPQLDQPVPLPQAKTTGHVRFENVTFSYGNGSVVVKDVSLDIPAGTTMALLGPTGSGKTTVASLVPRFYDPDAGRVLIDGIDVRDLSVRELRESVGVVDQEPFLFSASVADNLRFGSAHATDDELWSVLEAAQARDFVERLPNGLETMIGERGLTLSGGQRQRIAIARALLVNPRVLILDDATASVDSSVEARITQALHSATRGRTTILIAHRPSTIALADLIGIMDQGALVDVGTHDELIERNELYQQIYEQRAARREFLITEPEAGVAEGDESETASTSHGTER